MTDKSYAIEFVDKLINSILKKESDKYTNNPKDSGGPTKYGITETTARKYGYKGPMEDLTRGAAYNIYVQMYWIAPHFNTLFDVSAMLSVLLMDFGVVAGPDAASTHLQRVLNVLNRNQKDYKDLEPDGVIGPNTLTALRAFAKARGLKGMNVLHYMVASLQSVHFIEVAERRPKDEEFEYGWQVNRGMGVFLAELPVKTS